MLPSLLGRQRSTALAVDSAIVFLRNPPPSHGREMEGKGRQIPLAPLGRYPHFLLPPLRRQASFSAFVWGMSLNKTSKFCRHPRLWSAAISGRRIMRELHTGNTFFMSWSKKATIFFFGGVLLNRSRSRCPEAAPVAPGWTAWSWSSHFTVVECCSASWHTQECYFWQEPIYTEQMAPDRKHTLQNVQWSWWIYNTKHFLHVQTTNSVKIGIKYPTLFPPVCRHRSWCSHMSNGDLELASTAIS